MTTTPEVGHRPAGHAAADAVTRDTAAHRGPEPDDHRRTLTVLVLVVGLLAAVAAVTGLLWRGTGAPLAVTTLRGEAVEVYGRGLYRWDTLFGVANNWAGNAVVLLLGLPLLAVGHRWAQRSVRGALVRLGTLGFFVYMSVGYALGAMAYNQLFLVHVAFFSASLWAFVIAYTSLDPTPLVIASDAARRWIGGFLVASGVVTAAIWLMDPVAALLAGEDPASLDAQTTLFTHGFDLAVIAPAAAAGGVLILRRRPEGHRIAASLLVLEVALLPIIATATVLQIRLGITFTAAEIVGPITGFTVLAIGAVAALVALLRSVSDRRPVTSTPEEVDP